MARRGWRWRGLWRALAAGAREWERSSRAPCYGGAYRGAYTVGRGLAVLAVAGLCALVVLGVWWAAMAAEGGL